METVSIRIGPFSFSAKLESDLAPRTCEVFRRLLPFESQVIHSRWSGEAIWIPLGDLQTGLPFENHTSHPSRGDILLYPGGFSETEILLAYGSCRFSSKMGTLAGNHFLTVVEGRDELMDLGRLVLWQGAQRILFELGAPSAPR
jgi:hypothetical protein